MPLEGKCRANKTKFFPELSRFFIQIERGVSDLLFFLTAFIIFLPDSQLEPNACETLFSYVRTSFVQDKCSLLAVVSERWV
jgi:hypothetical protein